MRLVVRPGNPQITQIKTEATEAGSGVLTPALASCDFLFVQQTANFLFLCKKTDPLNHTNYSRTSTKFLSLVSFRVGSCGFVNRDALLAATLRCVICVICGLFAVEAQHCYLRPHAKPDWKANHSGAAGNVELSISPFEQAPRILQILYCKARRWSQ